MTIIEFMDAKIEIDSDLTKAEVESLMISLTSAYTTAVLAMCASTHQDDPTTENSLH